MKKRQVKFFKGDQVRLKKGCYIEGIGPEDIVKVFNICYHTMDVTIYIFTRPPGHHNYRKTGEMILHLSDFKEKFRKARKNERK